MDRQNASRWRTFLAACAVWALTAATVAAQGDGQTPWAHSRDAGDAPQQPASSPAVAETPPSTSGDSLRARTASAAPEEDPAPPDPQDPRLARFVFDTIGHEAPQERGSPMRTTRIFGTTMELCEVTAEDASCQAESAAAVADEIGGRKPAYINWKYAFNAAGKAVMLFTVGGRQDQAMGLQLIYGGDPKAKLLSTGDYVGAMAAGARIGHASLMGCRDNCVYGLEVDEQPGLGEWLASGDGIGFRFTQAKQIRQIPASIDGLPEAVAAMSVDETRRMEPGAVGDAAQTKANRTRVTLEPGERSTTP